MIYNTFVRLNRKKKPCTPLNFFRSCTGQSCCVNTANEYSLITYCSTTCIIPLLLSINPQSGNRNLLRWKIALWLLWVLNVSEPGMISTSRAELPWGHRAESCFNYPGFLLSHCHCEAPGATLPCSVESPCRVSDDNSDYGSTRSTDAMQVPSEIWEAESTPKSLWFSLCLSVFALCCSLFFHVKKYSWKGPTTAWKKRICIHTPMKWDLIACHQLPMWHWDHSL